MVKEQMHDKSSWKVFAKRDFAEEFQFQFVTSHFPNTNGVFRWTRTHIFYGRKIVMNQRVLFTVLKTSYLKNKLCLINFLIQNPPSLITTDHYRQCKTQKEKKDFKKIVHTNFMKFHSIGFCCSKNLQSSVASF